MRTSLRGLFQPVAISLRNEIASFLAMTKPASEKNYMFDKILNIGIYPGLSFQERNKIRIFNTACALICAISIFYCLFGLVNQFYLAAVVTLISVLCIVIAFTLIHLRKYNMAFHFTMLYGFAFLTTFTLLFGAYNKSYFYFLFMPVASTIVFDGLKHTIKYLVLSIVLMILNVMFTENMAPYYYIEDLKYFGYPNMIFTAILIFLGVRLFKQENIKYAHQVEDQRTHLEEKNKEITDSINYAQRIQRSLLASTHLLDENLPAYFIFFQPKDVVSGDFYWASELRNGHFMLATADSTGHGVPGAIMSMLNISCLNEAVSGAQLLEPNLILDYCRTKIIKTLANDGSAEGGKDGMDCSLISFDLKNKQLTYSAANNPVLIVRNNEVLEFLPDKMPVGKHDRDSVSFTQHAVTLQQNDVIYTLTDGMPDQFGGAKGKKFMYKQLKDVLVSISKLPMAEQKQKLESALNAWKGDLEQVDDICIIGIRV